MGLFSSVLGAGLSLGGSFLSSKQRGKAADAAYAAGFNQIPEILQPSLDLSANLLRQELAGFQNFDRNAAQQEITSSLAASRAPQIAQARARLQSQLLNRGRLGVGVGGGRTGALFQPEVAALEEAILQQQTQDAIYARDAANAERQQLLSNATGLFNLASPLIQRPNAGLAGLKAQAGFAKANDTGSFFSGLGNALGGLFGGGGSSRPPALFGGGLGNGVGGFFL